MKGSVYWDRFITNNDHQFFQDLFYSKTWKHFHFLLFVCTKNLFPFLEASAKFRMTKMFETQVHLFHAHADIKTGFTSFKSAFRNENIHEQKQGNCP